MHKPRTVGMPDVDRELLRQAIIDEYQYCETIGKAGKEPVLVARHMSTERMKPEKPFSVPAMMSTLLLIAKPVAVAARPA